MRQECRSVPANVHCFGCDPTMAGPDCQPGQRPCGEQVILQRDSEHGRPGSLVDHVLGNSARFRGALAPVRRVVVEELSHPRWPAPCAEPPRNPSATVATAHIAAQSPPMFAPCPKLPCDGSAPWRGWPARSTSGLSHVCDSLDSPRYPPSLGTEGGTGRGWYGSYAGGGRLRIGGMSAMAVLVTLKMDCPMRLLMARSCTAFLTSEVLNFSCGRNFVNPSGERG